MTSSPGPISKAFTDVTKALVPLEVATEYFAPSRSAQVFSNCST